MRRSGRFVFAPLTLVLLLSVGLWLAPRPAAANNCFRKYRECRMDVLKQYEECCMRAVSTWDFFECNNDRDLERAYCFAEYTTCSW